MSMSSDECQEFIHTYLYHNSFDGLTGVVLLQAVVHHVCKLLFAIGVVAVYIKARHSIHFYHQLVDNAYADEEGKKLHSISLMMTLIMVMSVFSIIANAIGRHLFVGTFPATIPSLVFSALLFALAWTGSRQRMGFDDIKEMLSTEDTDTLLNTSLPPTHTEQPNQQSKVQQLASQIVHLMEEEQLYLVSGLKVNDLAQQLNTNARYIQQALNEELGMSFSEYVNRHRVRHAAKLQNENPDIDVLTLSVQSGFASISSYYRNVNKFS